MPKINKSKLKAATLLATVIAAFSFVFTTLYPSMSSQSAHHLESLPKVADEAGK